MDLQFVEVELDPGESAVAEAGALMYMTAGIQMETIFGDGSAQSQGGGLMGALLGGTLFVEGLFARIMYVSLYRMHVYALHGFAKTLFDSLGKLITRRTEPRVKLH